MSNKDLPPGWAWAPFSEVAKIASHLVNPRERADLPHVAPDNMERDTGRLLPFRSAAEDKVTSAKHLFRSGQILYSKIRPYLNKCVRVSFEGLCSADVYPVDAHIDTAYLHQYMLTRSFVSAVSAAAGSRTILPKTNSQQLAQVGIPVAPLPEQRRIVEVLETHLTRLDEAQTLLERLQRNLKRYRASVLKAAVEGRLVPLEAELAKKEGRDYESGSLLIARTVDVRRETSELAKAQTTAAVPRSRGRWARDENFATVDLEALPRLPVGWSWSTADAVCTSIDSGSTPNGELFTAEGVPFIKVYNLTFDGSLNFTKDPTFISQAHHLAKMKRSTTVAGDVLMNIVGPPLGKVSLVPDSFPECNINQAIVRFRVSPALLPGFLRLYLQSGFCQAWLARTTKTTTSQVNLSLTTCRALPIPIPPIEEQVRMVEVVEDLLSSAAHGLGVANANIERLGSLRKAILKDAFEGKLVDQDPHEEPASIALDRIRQERAVTTIKMKSPHRVPARRTA